MSNPDQVAEGHAMAEEFVAAREAVEALATATHSSRTHGTHARPASS